MQEKPTGTALIPYAPGISEKLRTGNKYDITTAYRSLITLRSILTETRPPNQTQKSKNCIYNIPCECGKRYIGETCRPLQTRVNNNNNNKHNHSPHLMFILSDKRNCRPHSYSLALISHHDLRKPPHTTPLRS